MERNKQRPLTTFSEANTVENPPGIFRTTLAFNERAMICHFRANKGAKIPLHNHEPVQAGFVISGTIKFYRGDESSFIAKAQTSYTFEPNETHGAEMIEAAEFVEFFSPMRPEYAE